MDCMHECIHVQMNSVMQVCMLFIYASLFDVNLTATWQFDYAPKLIKSLSATCLSLLASCDTHHVLE